MLIECGLKAEWVKPKSGRHKANGASMTSILTVTSDLEFIDYRRIPYVGSYSALPCLTPGVGLACCMKVKHLTSQPNSTNQVNRS